MNWAATRSRLYRAPRSLPAHTAYGAAKRQGSRLKSTFDAVHNARCFAQCVAVLVTVVIAGSIDICVAIRVHCANGSAAVRC